MGGGSDDQARSTEEIAQRDGLGRHLSTIPLSSTGGTYAVGVLWAAVGVGFAALFVWAVPDVVAGASITGSLVGDWIALAVIGSGVLGCGAGVIGLVLNAISFRGRNLHTYTDGLVAETKTGPLSLRYADLLVYRKQEVENGVTRTEWGIERQDGTSCGVFDTVIPLADVWETTLARACEVQAAPQAAALAAGSTLTYGDVSFDGHRLRAPGVDVAWTDVKSVDVRQGRVIVNVARDGRLVKQSTKQVGMVGRIPNFPLFWPLFQRAFADSRPGTSAAPQTSSQRSAADRE